ncbi:hypothetical protein ACH9EU_05680 [Kocuria sp. M1R5S2]|uniref:hypothetical protein n=1 Tax=Kocuria rhizosphaerae TaxID=3376285 RepID=UPI0037A73841
MEEQNRKILKWCLSLMAFFGALMVLSQALLWPPEGGLEIVTAVLVAASAAFIVVLNVRYVRAGLWRRDTEQK